MAWIQSEHKCAPWMLFAVIRSFGQREAQFALVGFHCPHFYSHWARWDWVLNICPIISAGGAGNTGQQGFYQGQREEDAQDEAWAGSPALD